MVMYSSYYRKLLNSEWYPVETHFEGKLSCWKGKLLSYRDRLILVNSVLTSLPMFMLSFLQIPIGVRKRLDFYRSLGKVMRTNVSIGLPNGT